jgi:hypothetical protein
MSDFVLIGGHPTTNKGPSAKLWYALDLTDWLADAGAVSIASASIDCDGVTLEDSTIAAAQVLFEISGGTVGATAHVHIVFQSNDGQIDEATFDFHIRS